MRRHDERGSITPFVVIVSLAIIMLAALVVDGGRQLNAKGRAIAYAQEAARAGAQAVDVTDPRLDLDPALALDAAREYCREAMSADDQLIVCRAELAAVNDPGGSFKAVTVSTEVRIRAILMGIINRPTLQAGGQALARPVSGISDPDTAKVTTVGPPSVAPPGGGTPTATAPPTPPEIEVTPCKPKDPDEDKDDNGDKDDKGDKGDKDKDDKDDLEECKTPQ